MKLLPAVLMMSLFAGIASAEINALWEKTYGTQFTSTGYGIAIDSEGNVIVAGTAYNATGNGDKGYAVLKYTSEGSLLWARNYTGGFSDTAYAVAVDSQDNVIVTGRSHNLATAHTDEVTIKYDKNGNVLWQKSHPGHDQDVGQGIAVDSNGNIYTTAYSTVWYNQKDHLVVLTIKYDSNGNTLWEKNYTEFTDFQDASQHGFAIAADSEGNVVVVGMIENITLYYSKHYDWHVLKYDSNGNVLWNRKYTTPDYDRAYGVAIGARDSIIVTGATEKAVNATSGSDVLTIKYDKDGTEMWRRNYSMDSDTGESVFVDSSYNNYVVGHSYNSVSGKNNLLLIKYNALGEVVWVKSHAGPAGDAKGYSVAANSEGDIFTTGSALSADGKYTSLLTTKFGEPAAVPSVTPISPTSVLQNTTTSFTVIATVSDGVISNCSFWWGNAYVGHMSANGSLYNYSYRPASAGTFQAWANCTTAEGISTNTPTSIVVIATGASQNNTPNATQTVCGNGNCEAGETTTSCPADCPMQQNQPTAPPGTIGPTEVTATESIEAGMVGTFTFPNFDVSAINVVVKEAATNAKITAKKSDAKPATVATAPQGVIYKYLEITTENLADENVASGIIAFKVQKKWISDNNYDPATVKLMRWDDGAWTELTTNKVGEETDNYKYTAQTPGFSFFAIIASAAISPCNVQCPPGMVANSTTCACQYAVACTGAEYFDTVTGTCKAKTEGEFPFLWIALLAVGVSAAVVAALFITKGRGANKSVLIPPAQPPIQPSQPVQPLQPQVQMPSETRSARARPAAKKAKKKPSRKK